MEFRLNEEQVELQQTVARFCHDHLPVDVIASREDGPMDREVWHALATLGVVGLLAEPADGGSGLGAVEGAIVFEQLGYHLADGPLVWSVLAAHLIDGVIDGDVVVAGVQRADVTRGEAIVPHAPDADRLIVLGEDGISGFDPGSVGMSSDLNSLDPLCRVARVSALTSGERLGDAREAADVSVLGTVLTAAVLAGIAQRALDVAREYALEREQFDRPIGSFQAVKHMLADMYARQLQAQSTVLAAAALYDDPGRDDRARAASVAKLLAADAAVENAAAAVQVLGGMGFTWGMLPNYLLKRAWRLEQEFGRQEHHEEFLADLVGERRVPESVRR